MARSRTWNLRLNLDTFNAGFAALVDDVERAQFLCGLSLGMNGGKLRPESSFPLSEGFSQGEDMRNEAEGYRESRIKIGKLGGRPKEPHGLPDGLPQGSLLVNHMGNVESTSSEPNPQSTINTKEVPPLPPKGGRKRKVDLDCSPEVESDVLKVFDSWPKEIRGEKAHKGSFAQAARAFQRIIDSGEATSRELRGCGLLYAKAEQYPTLESRIKDAWEYRDQAIMHVSTFYGPEKKPYRQLLPLAREAIAHADEKAKQQQPILLEAM